MKNNKLGISSIEKIVYGLFFLVFLNTIIIKFEVIKFIPPKLGIPLASPGEYVDFFSKFKMEVLVLVALLLLPFFIYNSIKYTRALIPLDYLVISLAICVILSTLFSEFKYTALWGTHERFVGAIFFLIIIFFFYFSSLLRYPEGVMDILDKLLFVFLVSNLFFAILHYTDFNVLNSSFFQKIFMIPEPYLKDISGYVISTLENPNYLSGFCGSLAIFYLIKYLKSDKWFDLNFISFILSITLIFLSFSSSGSFSFVFSLCFFMIFSIVYKERQSIKKIVLTLTSYITITMILYFSNTKVAGEIASGFYVISNNIFIFLLVIAMSLLLFLISKNNKNIVWLNKNLLFVFIFVLIVTILIIYFIPGSPDIGQHFPEKKYTQEEILKALESRESIGTSTFSGREYMWWYTLDLVKEKPLFGHGMSTLIFKYPQMSILKIKKIGDIVVTKPHNHYLEILYGSGGIALGFFLCIFVYLIIKFLYFRSLNNDKDATALFFFMIAFLIQGFVNDMNVGTYPVIFILLGCLFSKINYHNEGSGFNGHK